MWCFSLDYPIPLYSCDIYIARGCLRKRPNQHHAGGWILLQRNTMSVIKSTPSSLLYFIVPADIMYTEGIHISYLMFLIFCYLHFTINISQQSQQNVRLNKNKILIVNSLVCVLYICLNCQSSGNIITDQLFGFYFCCYYYIHTASLIVYS